MGRRTTQIAALLTCALLAFGSSLAHAAGSPRDIVKRTVEDVIAILQNPALDSTRRRAMIEEIAQERFDLQTMSKLVLARNWKRLSDAQKEEYVREFTHYLASYYGQRIDRYDQEQLVVLGERQEPRGDVTVKTQVKGGQFHGVSIDYRMREVDGTWLVIDVVVEGISLVRNYRDQFTEVMSRSGPESLLKQLREKNASSNFE